LDGEDTAIVVAVMAAGLYFLRYSPMNRNYLLDMAWQWAALRFYRAEAERRDWDYTDLPAELKQLTYAMGASLSTCVSIT
jgi:hypothetical protein